MEATMLVAGPQSSRPCTIHALKIGLVSLVVAGGIRALGAVQIPAGNLSLGSISNSSNSNSSKQ